MIVNQNRNRATASDAGIAFFDVDETVISVKSMFSFVEALEVLGSQVIDAEKRELALEVLNGPEMRDVPRLVRNQMFYHRLLEGVSVSAMASLGQAWFRAQVTKHGFFHEHVLERIAYHKSCGAQIVLVSGSFPALLNPIANYIGADKVMCTELEHRDGLYTGKVLNLCIGHHKARRVCELLDRESIDADLCFAYGDHASDAHMLAVVGRPVVVGQDQRLARLASEHKWECLPARGRTLAERSSFL